MSTEIHDEVVNLYNSNHVGVVAIKGVMGPEKLKQIQNSFVESVNYFYPLEYGDASRWDLSEEDFCKFPSLELVRMEFRRMTTEISLITKFNSVYKEKFSVLFYPEGSSGVKPHRDSEHSVNCVIIFIVSGDTMFITTSDASSKNVIEFSTHPGDIIIMRGPRSKRDILPRPIHSIGKVSKPRYVIICRHINLEGLKI